jgi:hypothetical protein
VRFGVIVGDKLSASETGGPATNAAGGLVTDEASPTDSAGGDEMESTLKERRLVSGHHHRSPEKEASL